VVASPTGANSHNQIQVTIPAGQGVNVPVVINCNGQTNLASETPSFSYFAPFITSQVSNGYSTSGGSITLNGTNFGLAPQVLLNGIPTTLQPGNTHASITYNVPAGSGTNIQVRVAVAGQLSNTGYSFNYPSPAISSIAASSLSTRGGTEVTINGTNLGPASAAGINVNGIPVSALYSSSGHTSLKFILPPGEGAARALTVSTGGQSSPIFNFNYDAPFISRVIPSIVETGTSPIAIITGANFGLTGIVLVNGIPAPVSFYSHDHITCTLPPSASPGTANVEVVSAGRPSNTATFDYVCPADFNNDGSVDFFDYLDFVAAFSTPC